MIKRQVTHYPSEFKESSAKLAVDAEVPIAQTAESLGLNVSTLHGWRVKLKSCVWRKR